MVIEGRLNLVGTAEKMGWADYWKATGIEVGNTTIRNVYLDGFLHDRLKPGQQVTLFVRRFLGMQTLIGFREGGRTYKASPWRYIGAAVFLTPFLLYFIFAGMTGLWTEATGERGLKVLSVIEVALWVGLEGFLIYHMVSFIVAIFRLR